MKEENKWFWKVKRKMAPLFAELFVEGLNGKGFEEILPFPSKYQAIKGDKNNFGDIFYKEQDIKEVYDITNKAVKQNENFSKQFNKVSNKIFKRINQLSKKVIGQNLKAYNNKQLLKIYKQFYNSFTAGPIITIQLFAIEAMTNEDSELVTSCKKICLGKNLNFNKIIQDLQISVKETTLYTLRKDLLKICIMIKKKNEKTEKISNEFLKKYFWIDKNLIGKLPIVSTNNRITAYLDRIVNVKEFNFEDLSKLIKKELAKNIEKEYDVHKTYFQKISKERSNSINKLTPNKKLIQLINSMNTFIEQRDFSKREYVKALFSFNKLLIEISSRYKLCKEDLIYYSPKELLKLLE
ncbi:MAG: hypothetical protein KKF65_06880, partial [Nanoarchaeota archaeon]|nr:hypothetical protein [Nanoarchaeota archaeon]